MMCHYYLHLYKFNTDNAKKILVKLLKVEHGDVSLKSKQC